MGQLRTTASTSMLHFYKWSEDESLKGHAIHSTHDS